MDASGVVAFPLDTCGPTSKLGTDAATGKQDSHQIESHRVIQMSCISLIIDVKARRRQDCGVFLVT
jgi:hypothetical protein